MKTYTVRIPVKPFVAQWLVNAFGNPVEFPPQSVENSTLRRFARPWVDGFKEPDYEEEGVDVRLPDSKAKPPRQWRYLTPSGKRAVEETIEDLFRLNMWAELNDLSDTRCSVMTAVCAWCEAHGIDNKYAETIKMRYYRMRNSYLEKGIDLRRTRRNRSRLVNEL